MKIISLRQRALRYLARREHARSELKQKLAAHAASEAELDALLDELTAQNCLSDARYAQMRVASRSARFGNARLLYDLRKVGITPELAETPFLEIEEEAVRALSVLQRKYKKPPVDAKEKARQFRFLLTRGFSHDSIQKAFKYFGADPPEFSEEA